MHWLRGFLRQFAEHGGTVLISSHVLAEVAQTVDSRADRQPRPAGRHARDRRAEPRAGRARGRSTWSSPGMTAQLRSELLKQRSTHPHHVAAAGLAGRARPASSSRLHVASSAAGTCARESNQMRILGLGTSLGVLFAALVGALSITAEFRSGTIRPTLLVTPRRTTCRSPPRSPRACWSGRRRRSRSPRPLNAGAEAAGLALRGIEIQLGGGDYAPAARRRRVSAAPSSGRSASESARSCATRSHAVAALCVWLLLLENLVVAFVPDVGRFLPGGAGLAIAGAPSDELLAPLVAVLVLVLYATAASAAGWLATLRKDIA